MLNLSALFKILFVFLLMSPGSALCMKRGRPDFPIDQLSSAVSSEGVNQSNLSGLKAVENSTCEVPENSSAAGRFTLISAHGKSYTFAFDELQRLRELSFVLAALLDGVSEGLTFYLNDIGDPTLQVLQLVSQDDTHKASNLVLGLVDEDLLELVTQIDSLGCGSLEQFIKSTVRLRDLHEVLFPTDILFQVFVIARENLLNLLLVCRSWYVSIQYLSPAGYLFWQPVLSSQNSLRAKVDLVLQYNQVPVLRAMLKTEDLTMDELIGGRTLLFLAAFYGKAAIAKCLVKEGAQINDQTSEGISALYVASQNGHWEVAHFLLMHGANTEYLYNNMYSAVRVAAEFGHARLISLLIEKGANFKIKDINGVTPLHVACGRGHYDCVKVLVQSGADIEAKCRNEQITPVQLASGNGHVRILRFLIAEGADVNGNGTPNEALYSASQKGFTDIAKILLATGGLHVKNGRGTPMSAATIEGRVDVLKLLIQAFPEENISPLLVSAIRGKNVDTLCVLLEAKADPNFFEGGFTMLYRAINRDVLALVKVLLEYDADINDARTFGATALHTAACYGQTEIVRLLLEFNADTSLRAENDGILTALELAQQRGHDEIVRMILEHEEARKNTKHSQIVSEEGEP